MSKDPAFLFYPADASEDTQFMNRLERGAYFDLVKSQRLFHGYTAEQLRKVLGKDYDNVWPALELILKQDESGYFIQWVRESLTARKEFQKKQKERVEKRWNNRGNTVVIPEVNENEIVNENIIESKVESKSRAGKSPSCYTRFIDLYDKFVTKATGAPAMINAKQGRAAKDIIGYFSAACRKKNPEAGDEEIINSWSYILENYDRWTDFYRGQILLNQISSNLPNIINSIRNGRSTKTQQRCTTTADVTAAVRAAFGDQSLQGSTGDGSGN